jgi:hypothetical protein
VYKAIYRPSCPFGTLLKEVLENGKAKISPIEIKIILIISIQPKY